MLTEETLVSVVIVSWNGRQHLERCLPTLARSLVLVPGKCEVFVVDNGSTDGTLEYLRDKHPDIHVVSNDTNVGFGAANNQAFARASGRYVATLNNDTEVDERWLAELVGAIEREPDVGSVTAQMRFLARPDVINTTGVVIDRTGISRDRLDGQPVTASETVPTEVFGACAGAALYRANLLRQLGGFDDAFFAYLEDADLAWRARRAGWRCLYVPTAVVLHEYSATTRRVPHLKTYLIARNRLWMMAKNASPRQLWIEPLRRPLDEAVRVAGSLLRERTTAGVRGRIAGLRGMPQVRRHAPELPFLDLDQFAEPRRLRELVRARLRRDALHEGRR